MCIYRLVNIKWPSQYVRLSASHSLLWICIIAACPFRPSRDRCSLGRGHLLLCSGHRGGVSGVSREDRVVCWGGGGREGVCRMQTITDQQCWWDTNTNPSSWWNVPPTLAVPMVTHSCGFVADSLPECVCVWVLKDPRCALWSVRPCNPQAGFLGITNQPIRALTLLISKPAHTKAV